MRILQVVPHYIPAARYGGPQRVAHNLGKAMIALGHEVVVCTTNLRDELGDLEVSTDLPIDVEGVTVYYERTKLSRYWGFSPELSRRVSREMRHADLVLVHAHFQYANWMAARCARKLRVPYIIFPHSTLLRVAITHRRSLLKRAYLRVLEWKNLHEALAIAFNAEEEKERSVLGSRGIVVPNGIDLLDPDATTEFHSGEKREPRRGLVFGFLGRVDVQQKALDVLIAAFARHVREFPASRLVIAGPDENGGRAVLAAMAKRLGIEESVAFTGILRGADRFVYLRSLDAFVLPSRFEGGSIALLEALSTGIPVLVSDGVGYHRDISAAGAGVVVACDEQAVAAGLAHLAQDTLRAGFRGKGRELVVRRFTWDAVAAGMMAYVRSRGIGR